MISINKITSHLALDRRGAFLLLVNIKQLVELAALLQLHTGVIVTRVDIIDEHNGQVTHAGFLQYATQNESF